MTPSFMRFTFTEPRVEDAGPAWLKAQGWRVVHGPDIAPDILDAERTDYGQVVLEGRLRDALGRVNPDLSQEILEDI